MMVFFDVISLRPGCGTAEFWSSQRPDHITSHADMDVSENNGTPKSSILIGFSIINHPFWGTPIFGNTHMGSQILHGSSELICAGNLVKFALGGEIKASKLGAPRFVWRFSNPRGVGCIFRTTN